MQENNCYQNNTIMLLLSQIPWEPGTCAHAVTPERGIKIFPNPF